MAKGESPPIWRYRVPLGFWTHSKNRRAYFDWLERKLKIRKPEDWYVLTGKLLASFGGEGILSYYDNSVIAMLKDFMPWYDWKEWLFPVAPRGFWTQADNRRRYLDWLGEKLGFQEPEDWYQLRGYQVVRNRGSSMLERHRGSPSLLVMASFPDYPWREWKFRKAPIGFWDDPANVGRYLEWLGKELGFKETSDWYRLRHRDLRGNFGRALLDRYEDSVSTLVMRCFPDYEWMEWVFTVTPNHFWDDSANVDRYLQWLGQQLGFKKYEDWYRIRGQHFIDHHGHGLLQKFCSSPCGLVMSQFPEYDWLEWRFDYCPKNFWNDPAGRRRYLEWLGEKFGFKSFEDWYRIKALDFSAHHGEPLLQKYGGSPSAVLIDNFPEYEWLEWRFDHAPTNFWRNPDNRRRYLRWLGEKMGCKKPSDWRRLRKVDFVENFGGGLIGLFSSSPAAVLRNSMPKAYWKK